MLKDCNWTHGFYSIKLMYIFIFSLGAVAVSLNQPQYLITENSSFLPVTITLNDTVSKDVIVQVTISDGSANGNVE